MPAKYKGTDTGRLGIDVDDHFRPVYVVPPDKKKVVAELKAALKGADELILATDEDREGEAIGWHVLEVLKPNVPVKRMVFHEITPHAIEQALADSARARHEARRGAGGPPHPRPARRLGDLAGPVAGGRAAPARRGACRASRSGSSSSVSGPGWRSAVGSGATSKARSPRTARRFRARLVELDGQRVAEGRDFDPATGALAACRRRAARRAGARSLAERLRDADFAVTSVESTRSPSSRRAPFTTSTLQQESGRKLRFGASRTMSIAQRLYERGYITYMRTDSTNLSEQAITAARDAIREQYGEEYLPAEAAYLSTAR